MTGPPGVGKTMIAERIPTILPDMNFFESLEVTKIYSVSGTLDENKALIMERPFRNPHHTCSKIALIGGGNNLQPGEISLAHNGVLFLDEIIEFKKQVLEVLRQPLENRCIKISRARGTVIYPANFMLVGALNPCPCGNYGSDRACNCTESQRKKYIGKLSGPLIDRIDMFTFVRKISYKDIRNKKKSQSSNEIKRIVESARNLQIRRFKDENITCNSQMNIKLIYKYCKLNDNCKNLMEKIFDKYHLSTRAYTRILKVARTIADLNETSDIEEKDLIEAIQYRKFINEEIL
jgi:magnesium chelatase family protein